MSDYVRRLIESGVRIRKPRSAVAAPLQVLEQARPLPEMRPLALLGEELYPAVDMPIRPRVYAPGSIYPDEIEAIESVLPSVRQNIQDGMSAGYGQWAYTGPLQEAFRRELGRMAGDTEFRRFLGMTSASSNASPVPAELKKGSLMYHLHHQGLMPRTTSYEEAVRRVRQARGEGMLPRGYSGLTQGQDLHQINRFLSGEGMDFPTPTGPKARYKIPDYYNQKLGDTVVGTMDSWGHRWFGLPFQSRAYNPARLALLEAAGDYLPSQAQPSMWMIRGSMSPGMDSLSEPSFLHWYERALLKKARQLQMEPEKLLQEVIRGRQYLAKPQEWTGSQV